MSRLLKALRRLRVRWNRYLWIRDLRSGKFKQGQGLLCAITPGGQREYCCLGVGLVTLGFEFRDSHGCAMGNVIALAEPTKDITSVLLPGEHFRTSFGLAEVEVTTLVHMNDCNVPFPEIADRIAKFPITLPEEEK